ncbi:ABC transporter permease subunit [Actinoplanes sp. NPDC024001]|uniref:ABC transporter permease subunit n=1 Tax=Actinoplanes sp. NPDC024001 TaxID=3154598 RepID=UPI0033ECAA34
MSLYRAETRRLTKRRLTRIFVVLALLALTAVAAGTALISKQHTPQVLAAAQADADAAYQEQLRYTAEDKKRCEVDPAQYGGNCDNLWQPTQQDFPAESYLPPIFDFRDGFPDMVVVLAALLALAAFVVGASFVGVEWRTGGMMNLLLWRPQRLRVLSTKLAALLVGLTTLTVLTAAVWTVAFWAIGKYRGEVGRLTSGVWQSFGLTGLRALGLVLVAGALGFGLASIGRHTAAAFGVALGVVVVFQFGLGAVLEMAKVKFAQAYLLPYWIGAWMYKKQEVFDYNAPCDFSATNGCEPPMFTITWQMAGGLMAGVVALVLIAAMWTMRSRDLT